MITLTDEEHYQMNMDLEIFLFCISGMIQIRDVSLQDLAIVSHYVYAPTSLLAFFHDLNVQGEAFSLLITDITKVFREFVKKNKEKVDLKQAVY